MALSKKEIVAITGFLDRAGDGSRPIRGLMEASALTKCQLALQREMREIEARESVQEVMRPAEAPPVPDPA